MRFCTKIGWRVFQDVALILDGVGAVNDNTGIHPRRLTLRHIYSTDSKPTVPSRHTCGVKSSTALA